jgi:bifunctional non-homologous end joining protein LigD
MPPASKNKAAAASGKSSEKPAKAVTILATRRKLAAAKETNLNIASKDSKASKPSKSAMPVDLSPMLATLVDAPVEESGWSYELKWDGYRAIGYLNNGTVEIRSRNNKSFNEKFYPILDALKKWKINAVVDGEIIVVNEKGLADFSDLQGWRSEADGQLLFYLFDILWHEGKDLMHLPLTERRKLLQEVVDPGIRHLKVSDIYDVSGKELFVLADKMGLEGLIAKKEDSIYIPGTRSKEWLKIKTEKRQELVIGGYTKNENTSKLFSALLLGVYDNGTFHFVCPVGTGFNNKLQQELIATLKPLQINECPFSEVPDYNKPSRFRPDPPKAEVTWVKPEIVVEIGYREMTKGGAIRHPSFKRIREDKHAKEVVRETPAMVTDVIAKEENLIGKRVAANQGKRERKTLLNPKDETQVRNIDGHDLKFTNLSKVFWPDENVTKRDLLNYYYQVAPYMLPYMKDRPQTLNRFPHGINGESFYQKDVTGKVPGWIDTFPYHSERDGRDKRFLVASNEASLLYIASLGCIEMNPWSSRKQFPDHPDWCIIDLDPDKNPFEQVIEAAQVTKKVLDAYDIPSYCKTSGSTGLHIYIPLEAKYTYEQSKEFGRVIVKLVHREIPSFTSIERLTEKRKGCIYLDFLQNRPQATVAGPYSLRPKPGAPVSAPLHWEEVKKGLRLLDFTIFNMVDRIKEMGDLFTPVLGKGIDLESIVAKMEKELG